MASYIENIKSKLDWNASFQRLSQNPLDRSSIFKSYASAYIYASNSTLTFADLDGKDAFKKVDDPQYWSKYTDTQVAQLGDTAYTGQIITVYGAGISGVDEVSAYIITATGSNPQLIKLAQTSISAGEDVGAALSRLETELGTLSGQIDGLAADVSALETATGNLDTRVTALEGKEDKDTTYTFGVSETAGKVKLIPNVGEAIEGEVAGWGALNQKVEDVTAVAAGRTKSYVFTNKEAVDDKGEGFKTSALKINSFRLGDLIYFTDIDVPDLWVSKILDTADENGYYYEFSDLEARKVDLTPFLKSEDASKTYATKTELSNGLNNKADLSVVTDLSNTVTVLSGTVTDNKTEVDNKLSVVDEKLGTVKTGDDGKVISLQSQIDNIDVSGQIQTKITELKTELTTETFGADNQSQYVYKIKQENGKIIASVNNLPTHAEEFEQTLKDAKDYTDTSIATIMEGIEEGTTVKTYVDAEVKEAHDELSGEITKLQTAIGSDGTTGTISSRVKTIEDTIGTESTSGILKDLKDLKDKIGTDDTADTISSRVKAVETEVSTLKSTVSTHGTDIGNLKTTVASHGTAITDLQTEVASRIKEIQLGGVKQTMSTEGVVNITSVSTDLLSQGAKTLILDCLNATLVDDGTIDL